MIIVQDFEYFKPESIEEAVGLLSKYGDGGRVLAGGTDLVSLLADGAVQAEALVDIKGISALGDIAFENGVLTIGSLATFSDLIASDVVKSEFPLTWEMPLTVASVGIRNRATPVGNICSAVPCCDTGPILLVYDAEVLVTGPGGDRSVPIADWFVGPRQTVRGPGELVTGVRVTKPGKKHGGCFVKLRRYKGEDLAQASVSVLALEGNEYRISFGSVAPKPIRGTRIEALLNGYDLTDKLLKKAVDLVDGEISPITDIRATAEYRSHMCKVMLKRGLRAAVDRMNGGGPAYGTEVI
ncbi:MAG: xanthine dehydrogenase family protein subunit M [Verrucomicrobia bacterium]|nr:xanthine dehydrogenase family protein subunit M [Verrucomicrobiota bacterium]